MSGGPVIDLAEARVARTPHAVAHGRCVGCGHRAVHVLSLALLGEHRGLECGRCGRFLVTLVPVESLS